MFNRCVFVFQSGFLALVAFQLFQTFLDFAAVCLVASVTLVFWLLGFFAFAFCCFWLPGFLPFVVSWQYAAIIVQTKS